MWVLRVFRMFIYFDFCLFFGMFVKEVFVDKNKEMFYYVVL